jgi:hypothetical protein
MFNYNTLQLSNEAIIINIMCSFIFIYPDASFKHKNFTPLFQNLDENDSELEHLMSQFTEDPSKVLLKFVCQTRVDADDPIILRLRHILPDQLQVVRRHNWLYKTSSIFRQIHEKVIEDEGWASSNKSSGWYLIFYL